MQHEVKSGLKNNDKDNRNEFVCARGSQKDNKRKTSNERKNNRQMQIIVANCTQKQNGQQKEETERVSATRKRNDRMEESIFLTIDIDDIAF